MIRSGELAAQRRITQAFIDADWVMVTLNRSEWLDDGAGGRTPDEPVALDPQKMRLIPRQDGAVGSVERTTADGQEVAPTYILMGTHDADMQRWDTFTLAGKRYEVVFVGQNQQYELKGEVWLRG